MKIAIAFFHFALIFVVGYLLARRWQETKSKLFWSALTCHFVAAMVLGLVYQYYYSTNDTWEFFNQASKLADFAKTDPSSYVKLLFNFDWDQRPFFVTHDFRSIVFVKMVSLFCLIGGNSYWVCAGYFALISFSASWFLFRKVKTHFTESAIAATIAFLFFPSVVFWSSGIVKETFALASLYLLAGIFLSFYYERKIGKLDLAILFMAGVILWTLKYYWAGVFFIAAIAALILQFLPSKNSSIKNAVVAVYPLVFLVIGVAVSFFHPNFYLNRFLEVLVANHDAFLKLSNGGGGLIHYDHLNSSLGSILINSPWALISGIFRPFIGESRGAFGLAASLENLVVLILFISFLWRLKKRSNQSITVLTLAVISYCIVLCIFLALSTPNLGTLSRYRVGFMPFLIFMLAYRNPLIDSIGNRVLGRKD
jgi:hypothetical protein